MTDWGLRHAAERTTGRIDFGRSTPEQVPVFMTIMRILHSEPLASAFVRLLTKRLGDDDYVQLAHFFEELGVLALHRHIAEELLFDALALDMYWDELREDVIRKRIETGNDKFCENFEIAADRAREYRHTFPSKLRWEKQQRPGDDEPPDEGGLGDRRPGFDPGGSPFDPQPGPATASGRDPSAKLIGGEAAG
ncbi:hypothetical protein EPN29_01245 [bacterium]|nr:MAG: hypothetical protein EPN29_01245 [bacterium]